MPSNDVEIRGNYSVKEYQLTYILDGEEYATLSVEYGAEIPSVEEPTKEGHTFSGWSEAPATMPAKDVFIEGSFMINSYTLIYKVDGVVYKNEPMVYGAAITLIEHPTKVGYTFSGWSEAPETMPAENVVVEGSFVANSYIVTYILDGEEYATLSVEYGAEIPSVEEPTKEGHTFIGWSEIPATMPAEDIVIEGSYEVNNYTITYLLNGEEYKTELVPYGSSITPAEVNVEEYCTFSGWEMKVTGTYPIDIKNNADQMLHSNAYCTNTQYGDQFAGWSVLFDGKSETFFHSEYGSGTSDDGLDHYLRVDMGEGNSVSLFTFTFKTRNENSEVNSPTTIVVEGSNEADGEYTEIATLTGLPTTNSTVYTSEILGSEDVAYRYIRYRVTETGSNQTDGGEKIFFFMAEFGMNCVKIQIKIKLKSHCIQNWFSQSQISASVVYSQRQSISL